MSDRKRITWGFLGKQKTYVHSLFKSVPDLTEEDRRRLIEQKMKPYNSADYLDKIKVVVGGGGVYESPTPVTPTPTPSFTPTVTPTAQPTPTPSYTPSVTPSPSVPAIDADAAAFLNAVVLTGGTVDATMSGAVETLVSELKTAGVWSKIDVFLPVIGGTADAHKINLVEPSNATFDYTYFGTVNHGVSGMTTDSNLGAVVPTWYAEELVQSTSGSSHYALYRNRAGSSYGLNGFIGTYEGTPYKLIVNGNYGSDSAYAELYGGNNTGWNAITNNGLGNMTLVRSGTTLSLYQNGSLIQTRTSTTYNFTHNLQKVALLALWWTNYPNNIYDEVGDQRVCTFSIGAGLTSTERADLETAIDNFNTTLGRQI